MAVEGETYDCAGANFLTAIADTVRFYRCLLYFLSGGTYKECPYFTNRLQVGGDVQRVRVLPSFNHTRLLDQRYTYAANLYFNCV